MANFDELLSSLNTDINAYTGKDPLLPWLRGIRKMKDTLPPQTLNEKLPDFLQKCAHAFELDRRYKNDMRYLRVWLHLMDFVDDPRALLKTMEVNQIGTKRCQFYQAYALCHEKSKRYDEAEKMYHLGVQNLAEPLDELQKSYDQFLQRMKRKSKKRIQQKEVRSSRRPLSTKDIPPFDDKAEGSNQIASSVTEDVDDGRTVKTKNSKGKRFHGDDTVVGKFVGTAMDGKSVAEDACHHGLVDPTINMKEAMNDINSMFREPLETVPLARRSHKTRAKEDRSTKNNFEVFVDENLDNGIKNNRTESSQPHQEPFQIYIDDEGCPENNDINVSLSEGSASSASKLNGFVFQPPKDLPSEKSSDMEAASSRNSRLFREDTIVGKFVGSAILDLPQVENVCHHGLVEPTINMKEAMNDINGMFVKPMDFVRRKRSMKQEKAPDSNSGKELGGFSILVDDDLKEQQGPPPRPPKLPRKESDLYEPTLHTKEARDDINKMFNMPLDF